MKKKSLWQQFKAAWNLGSDSNLEEFTSTPQEFDNQRVIVREFPAPPWMSEAARRVMGLVQIPPALNTGPPVELGDEAQRLAAVARSAAAYAQFKAQAIRAEEKRVSPLSDPSSGALWASTRNPYYAGSFGPNNELIETAVPKPIEVEISPPSRIRMITLENE